MPVATGTITKDALKEALKEVLTENPTLLAPVAESVKSVIILINPDGK